MTGVLGIGGNLSAWTDAERAEVTRHIAQYKRIRAVVQHGELFRLGAPRSARLHAIEYADSRAESVVVFAFRPSPDAGLGAGALPLRLRGLPPSGRYRDVATGAEYPARVLARHGLPLTLPGGEYASEVVHLQRVPGS